MAKGDDSRARNQVTAQTGLAQNNLNNLRNDTLIPQNQTMWNNYLTADAQNKGDYGNITNRMNNFADTGGFSPTDLSNIRARSNAPIRGMYAGANREVDRSRALQGGYSPGYGVLKARMARDESSGLSDAATNTEGMIAGLVNQGKQYGTSGLLSAYGATPGQTALAGNQALTSTGQRLQGEQLQGDIGKTAIQGQIQAGQLPGKFQSTVQDINGIMGIGQQAAGMIYPWLGSGTGGTLNARVPGSYASNLYQSGGFGQPGVR